MPSRVSNAPTVPRTWMFWRFTFERHVQIKGDRCHRAHVVEGQVDVIGAGGTRRVLGAIVRRTVRPRWCAR